MTKLNLQFKAKELRKSGMSIKGIAKELHVSPASTSKWCKDIMLTEEQLKELSRQAKDPFFGKRGKYLNDLKQKTIKKTEKLHLQGINEVGLISKRELFLAGVALYWAEGFKKDSRAGFASSDPAMIKLFIKWLMVCCGYTLKDLKFRVTANISHKYRISEIQDYWQEVTEAKTVDFQKPFFQNVVWQRTYSNPENYYGVLRIRILKSTDFLRKIKGWIHGLGTNRIITV